MIGTMYQQYDPRVAIEGFGDDAEPTKLGLAEQSFLELIRIKRIPPLGVFTPWGVQTGSIDWETVAEPDYNVVVYPVTDSLIRVAERDAFGHELGFVAVLTPRPVTRDVAEKAFIGTPFELLSAEAIYRLDDAQPVPQLYYLYYGKRRDDFTDSSGGRGTLEPVAQRLGGQLVFPVQRARSGKERSHPSTAVTAAMAVQSMASGEPPVLPVVAAPPAAQPGGGLPWWAYTGVAAAAAWLGWRWVKRRRQEG
jgi:hypothetical protein